MKFQDTLPIGNKAGGWRKLIQVLERRLVGTDGPVSTRLREVHAFGSNPGNLRMFSYRPPKLAENPALVVVLHGCTQTAAGYDLGAGWSTLADRYGFALLFPEQQRFNNPNGCFNWFQDEDSQRDQSPSRPAREWGDLVRKASSHHGVWPRVSVWHGNADKTVIPSNAREILKQWTDVHGLSLSPSAQTRVDGYPREVWMDGAGDEILESYTITNMAHGTPLAIGEVEGACGAAGPFLLPVGISSSYHISKFFGIADAHLRQRTPAETESLMMRLSPAPTRHEERVGPVLEGEILEREDEPRLQQELRLSFPEVSAVIQKALKAAGLIRD